MFPGILNENANREIIVVDNFLHNPDQVRGFALAQEYENGSDYYKGRRTHHQFLSDELKESFENLLGKKITYWQGEGNGMNGRFQFCTPEDPLVYHADLQDFAGLLFLSPDAPFETGTSFYRNKANHLTHVHTQEENMQAFKHGFFDKTKFELVDTVGNVYNRLVLFNGKRIHAASNYFGQNKSDARLFQIFFFNYEI